VSIEDLPSLISRLDLAPIAHRWSERVTMWDGWVFLAALTFILAAEWLLRKWWYLP
jgi:hypothetical protein